jgi:hypothetical protein
MVRYTVQRILIPSILCILMKKSTGASNVKYISLSMSSLYSVTSLKAGKLLIILYIRIIRNNYEIFKKKGDHITVNPYSLVYYLLSPKSMPKINKSFLSS